MKNLIKNFGIVFLVFIALALIFSFGGSNQTNERVGVEKLIGELNTRSVKSITVEGSRVDFVLQNE